MTTKQVAKTIQDMCSSERVTRLLNLNLPVDTDLINELVDHWKYDLYSRKPGPAMLENGALKPTDLDLACFLSALVDRKAVINLPKYKSRRAATVTEGERVVSKANRHGRCMGLTGNKDVFSFSLRIEDMNIVTASEEGDSVGAPRNYMLVDLDGSFYDGWQRIEFSPTAKENDFLKDNKLWTGNTVVFDRFVSPNRWVSFYGQYYLLSKLVIARLEQDVEFLNSEIKRLQAEGVRFPAKDSDGAPRKVWPKSETVGEKKSIKVPAMQAEVDAPWFGERDENALTSENLQLLAEDVKEIKHKLLPPLRFATRVTELAWHQKGGLAAGFPAWIKNASWEHDYVVKGKRTKWSRLVFHQTFPGVIGFALRVRTYEKSERVAA